MAASGQQGRARGSQGGAANASASTGRDAFGVRLRRRLQVWPLWCAAGVIVLGLLPLWMAVALVHDLVRPCRFAGVRWTALAASLLALEAMGVATASVLGLLAPIDSARGQALHRALQIRWGRSVLGVGMALMSMRLVVEGEDVRGGGPAVVLPRHASLADALLPTLLLAGAGGFALRFVLKRELLADPCLDLVGNRLPNAFIRRSGDSEGAARQLAALAEGLGPGEAVVIYPEGTRASQRRRQVALAAREAAGDREGAARIASFRRLLPPHAGGVEALLAAAPEADVVLLGHVGFDDVVTLRDMLGGKLVGRTVRVRLERVVRREIPASAEDRRAWLDVRWRAMDHWVDAALAAEAAADRV